MADYIDRGKAVLAACEGADAWDGGSNSSRDKYLAEYIDSVPPADVVEVRHGKWIWVKDHWECSVCRGPRFHDLVLGVDASYCGRCGAKMDGDGE